MLLPSNIPKEEVQTDSLRSDRRLRRCRGGILVGGDIPVHAGRLRLRLLAEEGW